MTDANREVLETVGRVLMRCWIAGFVLQLITFGAVLGMSEVVHDMHAMLGLTNHESDLIVVAYTALLKLFVAVFFFIPWLAIVVLLRTKST